MCEFLAIQVALKVLQPKLASQIQEMKAQHLDWRDEQIKEFNAELCPLMEFSERGFTNTVKCYGWAMVPGTINMTSAPAGPAADHSLAFVLALYEGDTLLKWLFKMSESISLNKSKPEGKIWRCHWRG